MKNSHLSHIFLLAALVLVVPGALIADKTPAVFQIPPVLEVLMMAQAPAASEKTDPTQLKIGDIRIFGNEKIRSHILRREIPFQKGDFYNEEKLSKARERIRQIPGVDYLDFRVAYTPNDSSLVLTAIITEKPTVNGRPLIRRGYQNKFSFGLELWEKNFRGRSELLTGYFLLRGNTIVTASWENPWIGSGPRLGMGVAVYYKEYLYVYDDLGPDFTDAPIERFGGELKLFHQLSDGSRISLSGCYESSEVSPLGDNVESEKEMYTTIGLSLVCDSRKHLLYPWNGIYVEAAATKAGMGSELISFNEVLTDLRLFKSVNGRGIIAGHGRLRYLSGDKIPIYRRQHIGGAQSLRGYEYGSFHGVRSIVTGIEGRLPVNFSLNLPVEDVLLGIAWHAFADAAAAWDDDKNLTTRTFHGTFGVGLSILSKGMRGLRFDYGWRMDGPGRFEFDIGMKF